MTQRQDFIDRLETRIREWSAQLDELRVSSKDAFEGLREGTERAWEDVASGLDEAIGRLRKRATSAPRTIAEVESIMTRGVEVCRPEDTLNAAARILWERDCGFVPVVDEAARVVGVVTDRDVCMTAYFQNQRLSDLRVGDRMSTDVVACRPGESLEAAMDRMKQRKVRRLPVVDDEGRLVGVLSQNDIVRESWRDLRSGKRIRRVRPERIVETLGGIGEQRASRRGAERALD